MAIVGDGIRFIVAGAINSLITVILYQLLLGYFSHSYSYALSWIIGMMFLIVVYPSKVFRVENSGLKNSLLTIFVYIATFYFGLKLLDYLVLKDIHPRLAIFLVMGCIALINFLLTRKIYKKNIGKSL